ncbi:unnamed protein product, partial [Ixodes hexagonus]
MTYTNAQLFYAHCIGGTVFFILGTWWAIGAWYAYSLRRHERAYYRRTAYSVLPGVKPRCVEGFYKITVGALALAGFGRLLIVRGVFNEGMNAQHLSVALFVFLNGVLDLLTHYKAPIPRGTDYVGLLMALCVEALLFSFHLHGREKLDVLAHKLLVLAIASEAACVGVEMCHQRNVLATLGRAFFGILQGTWFCQIAFILYNQLPGALPWEDDHQSLMLAAAVFTWHMFGVLLYLALVGTLVSTCLKNYLNSGWTEKEYSA